MKVVRLSLLALLLCWPLQGAVEVWPLRKVDSQPLALDSQLLFGAEPDLLWILDREAAEVAVYRIAALATASTLGPDSPPRQPPFPRLLGSWPLPDQVQVSTGKESTPANTYVLAPLDRHETWLINITESLLWRLDRGTWHGPWQSSESLTAKTVAALAPGQLAIQNTGAGGGISVIDKHGRVPRRFAQEMPSTPPRSIALSLKRNDWLLAKGADGSLLVAEACGAWLRRFEPDGRLRWQRQLDGPPADRIFRRAADGQLVPRHDPLCEDGPLITHLQAFGEGLALRFRAEPNLERLDPAGYWLESLPLSDDAEDVAAKQLWDSDSQVFFLHQGTVKRFFRGRRPLQGRVLAAGGGRAEGALVLPPLGELPPMKTDKYGSFQLLGLEPTETTHLRTVAGGFEQRRLVGVPLDLLSRVIFLQPAPEQCVWVYNRYSSEPIAHFEISVQPETERAGNATWSHRQTQTFDSKDGRGCLRPPFPLPWQLRVSAQGYAARQLALTERGDLEVDLEPEARLEVRVVSSEEPIASCRVSATLTDAGFETSELLEVHQEVVTNTVGIAQLESLEAGRYQVEARQLGFEPWRKRIELSPGDNQLTVDLMPGGTVVVNVRSSSGQPISEARVRSIPLAHEVPGRHRCITDSVGQCYINGLPSGGFRAEADADGFAAGFETFSISPGASEPMVVEVVLENSVRLVGKILGVENYPGTPLRLSAAAPGVPLETATVDAAGDFTFASLPVGPVRLHVLQTESGGLLVERIELPFGVEEHRVTLELPWPNQVTGWITDSGNACTGCMLIFEQLGGQQSLAKRRASTGSEGYYSLDLPATGLFRVTVSNPASGGQLVEVRQVTSGAQLDFDLAGASLSGVVRHADGNPAAGAKVRIDLLTHELGAVQGRQTATDSFGRFAISGLTAGRIAVSASLRHSLAADQLALSAGEQAYLELRLPTSPGLTLRVFDGESGQTIERIAVRAWSSDGGVFLNSSLAADSEGLHHLPAPGDGEIQAVVEARGFTRRQLAISADLQQPIELPLDRRYRNLQVQISAKSPQPCWFELSANGLPVALAVNLPPGRVPLRQRSANYSLLEGGVYSARLEFCDGQVAAQQVVIAAGGNNVVRF